MTRSTLALSVALAVSGACVSQDPPPEEVVDVATPAETSRAPVEVVSVENSEQQIRAAVTAAPEGFRDRATVLGYSGDGKLVPIRAGTNGLTCLADSPADDRFQVACYHDSMEPYMERGRKLRAEGITGPDNLQVRHDEIDAGTLAMPEGPTTVYTLGGSLDLYDPETGAVAEERAGRVYSVYTAYATEESTGLSTTPPHPGAPWIMRPGTPSAHVMVVIPSAEEDS